MELSYPEFKGAPTKVPQHSRAGYLKKWMGRNAEASEPASKPNTSRGPSNPQVLHDRTTDANADNGPEDVDEEPVPVAEEEEDLSHIDPQLFVEKDAMELDVQGQGQQANRPGNQAAKQIPGDHSEPEDNQNRPEEGPAEGEEEDQLPEEAIQVLNIHSKRPLFSYRGQVFEGQWAEMIGTDVILARHEEGPGEQLPALRNLPGDVDLLGASASRILTTRKTLKPKTLSQDSLEPIRKEWNINIPLGKSKDTERAQQANFLERLMALKIKKGQEDKVTVYAQDGIGKDFDDKKDAKPRIRRKRPTVTFGDEDEDNDSTAPARRKRRLSSQDSSRGARPRASTAHRGILRRSDQPQALSTPTPKHWEDLEAEGGNNIDFQESDEDNNEDDYDEEDDEDADQNEDEDDDDDEDNDEDEGYERYNDEAYDTVMEAG